MANSNYGILLQRETGVPGVYATIGEATSLDLPKYITDELESTNHSSAGVRTFITSGLVGMDAFSAVYNCDAALVTLVKTDMRAKTITNFKIIGLGDFGSLIFKAFFKSFQVLGADAQSPDVIKAQIELQPTAALAVA